MLARVQCCGGGWAKCISFPTSEEFAERQSLDQLSEAWNTNIFVNAMMSKYDI
jgi:hypothetical protein